MEKAIIHLSEKLRHPSDLQTKLSNIEKATKDERDMLNNNLNNMMTSCYTKITDTAEHIAELDTYFKTFTQSNRKNVKVLEDFLKLMKDYKSVKLICLAHSNLSRVTEFSERLKTVDAFVPPKDLLEYHSIIYEDEEFVYELEMYNQDITREEYIEVLKAVNMFKKRIYEFYSKVLEIGENIMENSEIMEQIAIIVDKEEKRDELTIKAQTGETADSPVLKEIYRMYRKYISRPPRRLKEKVISAMCAYIRTKLNKTKMNTAYIYKLDFVLEELSFIKENIVLEIFPFDNILKAYHSELKTLLDETTADFDAGEILAAVEFVTNYYNTVETKFNKMADALGPPLLQNETTLLEKFTSIASSKLKEWIINTTKLEVNNFYQRTEPPGKDESNKLISKGFISIFQTIRMQLEPIAFNKRILAHITKLVVHHCEILRANLLEAMEKDLIPSLELKRPMGYEDYCIMFGNSGLKIAQSIVTLPQYQSDEVRELGNIFLDILKSSNRFLSEFVIRTCQEAIDKIFTPEWETENITKLIILTLEDFLSDYQRTMTEYSFVNFVRELCTALSLAYLNQLSRKSTSLDLNSGKKLQSDHRKLLDVFLSYGEEEDVKSGLSPLHTFIPLLESRNADLFILELKSLKITFPDMKIKFVKNIIKKRADLNEAEKNSILAGIKICFGEELSSEKTIFSKLLRM